MKTIQEELREAVGAGRGPISRLVLEAVDKIDDLEKTVELLRESAQALTCAKAEPIAWLLHFKPPHGATYSYKEEITFLKSHAETMSKYALRVIPLYTHPPKQEQPPKVAPTVAIDERAEFEKSTKLSGVSIKNDTARNIDGDYYSLPVQYAWEGWQAARKLPAPEVISKTTDTVVPDETAKCAVCGNKLSLSCCDKGAK